MSETISTLEDYLDQLRRELTGSDPALIQDALYDAEEHLRTEFSSDESDADGSAADRLRAVIERYGTPREVAEAYRTTDTQVAAALAPPRRVVAEADVADKIFGVLFDPRTYGSLFYMFLALVTGIVYFVWVVTGLSLSLGLSVMIFGVPVFLLFLATVRAIALAEGRIVETLLGERMPRRPVFDTGQGTWLERFKQWLTDTRTWSTMLYMALQLPLGIFYFTFFTVLLVLSGSLFLTPFAQLFFDFPLFSIWGERYDLPWWGFPLVWVTSLVLLLAAMHLARLIGRLHGSLAKTMLVSS